MESVVAGLQTRYQGISRKKGASDPVPQDLRGDQRTKDS